MPANFRFGAALALSTLLGAAAKNKTVQSTKPAPPTPKAKMEKLPRRLAASKSLWSLGEHTSLGQRPCKSLWRCSVSTPSTPPVATAAAPIPRDTYAPVRFGARFWTGAGVATLAGDGSASGTGVADVG